MTQHTTPQSPVLPTTVRDFIAQHNVRGADLSAFLTEDVLLDDVGQILRGRDEAQAFLRDAAAQFEVTTEQTGARRLEDHRWEVTLRLEGTFPGGVAELDYRFTLRHDRIAELVVTVHEA